VDPRLPGPRPARVSEGIRTEPASGLPSSNAATIALPD
jgi:hypothetical protein